MKKLLIMVTVGAFIVVGLGLGYANTQQDIESQKTQVDKPRGQTAEPWISRIDKHDIALFLTAITAISALAAAIGALRSAKATKRATEAQLFSWFYKEYRTTQMHEDLKTLRSWQNTYGSQFVSRFKEKVGVWNVVDQARRRVKTYFLMPLRLHEAGYVDEQFVKNFADVYGIEILFDIVEHLEYALKEDYERSSFDQLHQIIGGTYDRPTLKNHS